MRKLSLFVLVNLILIAVLLEIFVRLTLHDLVSDRFIQADETLGHVHIPNRKGLWRSADFVSEVHINSQGLQDEETPYAKPEDVKRILVIGDSFVEALQVERAQNFTALLENDGLEIINGGVLAYGTAHALRFLETEGLRYEPDAVVYVFYHNDVHDSAISQIYDFENGILTPQKRDIRFRDQLRPRLYDWFYTFRIGAALYDNQRRLSDSRLVPTAWRAVDPLYLRELPPAEQAAWDLTGALLARMATLAAEEGLPLLVVYMPDLFQIEDSIWAEADSAAFLERDKPNQTLASWIPEGVEFLDLTPIFREMGQALYFPNDGHLTPAGHQAAAEALRDPVLALLGE